MAARLRGHKQRKLNYMFVHSLCLCLLGPTIKLNFTYRKWLIFRDVSEQFAVRVFPKEGIDLET